MTELQNKTCEPCEGGADPMSIDGAKDHLDEVDNWELMNVPKIKKRYQFSNFEEAIEFVNDVAEISESEGHHPNIQINYDVVELIVWTHAIDGLSENDFILAAKLDNAAKYYNQ